MDVQSYICASVALLLQSSEYLESFRSQDYSTRLLSIALRYISGAHNFRLLLQHDLELRRPHREDKKDYEMHIHGYCDLSANLLVFLAQRTSVGVDLHTSTTGINTVGLDAVSAPRHGYAVSLIIA